LKQPALLGRPERAEVLLGLGQGRPICSSSRLGKAELGRIIRPEADLTRVVGSRRIRVGEVSAAGTWIGASRCGREMRRSHAVQARSGPRP
jgi:hypothetical protein